MTGARENTRRHGGAEANFSTAFGRQHIPMEYRGELIGEYIPDLIVENTVVVEVKSVSQMEPVFTAQVVTCG